MTNFVNMHPQQAKSSAALRKRISRFLGSRLFARHEIVQVLSLLSPLGEIALFGGALRDLALYGNARFPNDIDLVIESEDFGRLRDLLQPFNATQNRYGGFTFRFEKWKFDVWSLSGTWAVRQGLVHASSLSDLVRTTFFDWDAVVYETSSRRLTFGERYLDRLGSGILGINLIENPNPVGNAVRALRSYRAMRAGISFELAAYVLGVLEEVGGNTLVEAERAGYRLPLLDSRIVDDMAGRLRGAVLEQVALPLAQGAQQLGMH